jgi:hypothetical protein
MKYQEQLERINRLFLKINPPSGGHGDQSEYEDNLWYFFQTAWHLKDWIKNDSSIKDFGVQRIVENYSSLRICADLANRAKHLTLTKHIREDAKQSGNDVTVHLTTNVIDYNDLINGKIPIGTNSKTTYIYYVTDKSGSQYQAVELAKKIIEDWKEIINNYVRTK